MAVRFLVFALALFGSSVASAAFYEITGAGHYSGYDVSGAADACVGIVFEAANNNEAMALLEQIGPTCLPSQYSHGGREYEFSSISGNAFTYRLVSGVGASVARFTWAIVDKDPNWPPEADCMPGDTFMCRVDGPRDSEPSIIGVNGCEFVVSPAQSGITWAAGFHFLRYVGTGNETNQNTDGVACMPSGDPIQPEGVCGSTTDEGGAVVEICVNGEDMPDDGCGTFNGELVCPGDSDAPEDAKAPPQGCVTNGEITKCAGDAPNTTPPRPAKEQGGSVPTKPVGGVKSGSGRAGDDVEVHHGGKQGGYDSGSGLPESGRRGGAGGKTPGDEDGDGECAEGETCAGAKVEVGQLTGFAFDEQAQRQVELEQELMEALDKVKAEAAQLVGGLPESGGSLPDYSFDIPWPGGSIPVNWNLGLFGEQLKWLPLAILFIAALVAVVILLDD